MSSFRFPLALLLLAPFTTAQSIAWDEGVSGDLSNDPLNPTPIVLAEGTSRMIGTVSATGSDVWDYVTFTLPPGARLVALRQIVYEDLPSGDIGDPGFHAIIAGATSFDPDPLNISNFLGSDLLLTLPSGTDMLPNLAAAPNGGMGFTIPLGPGTYTYNIQQTGPELSGYEVEFLVIGPLTAPVLPPAAQGLLAALFLAAGAWTLRRRAASLA